MRWPRSDRKNRTAFRPAGPMRRLCRLFGSPETPWLQDDNVKRHTAKNATNQYSFVINKCKIDVMNAQIHCKKKREKTITIISHQMGISNEHTYSWK